MKLSKIVRQILSSILMVSSSSSYINHQCTTAHKYRYRNIIKLQMLICVNYGKKNKKKNNGGKIVYFSSIKKGFFFYFIFCRHNFYHKFILSFLFLACFLMLPFCCCLLILLNWLKERGGVGEC